MQSMFRLPGVYGVLPKPERAERGRMEMPEFPRIPLSLKRKRRLVRISGYFEEYLEHAHGALVQRRKIRFKGSMKALFRTLEEMLEYTRDKLPASVHSSARSFVDSLKSQLPRVVAVVGRESQMAPSARRLMDEARRLQENLMSQVVVVGGTPVMVTMKHLDDARFRRSVLEKKRGEVARIGEVREWKDGWYKKVNEGEWERVKGRGVSQMNPERFVSEDVAEEMHQWFVDEYLRQDDDLDDMSPEAAEEAHLDRIDLKLQTVKSEGALAYGYYTLKEMGDTKGAQRFLSRLLNKHGRVVSSEEEREAKEQRSLKGDFKVTEGGQEVEPGGQVEYRDRTFMKGKDGTYRVKGSVSREDLYDQLADVALDMQLGGVSGIDDFHDEFKDQLNEENVLSAVDGLLEENDDPDQLMYAAGLLSVHFQDDYGRMPEAVSERVDSLMDKAFSQGGSWVEVFEPTEEEVPVGQDLYMPEERRRIEDSLAEGPARLTQRVSQNVTGINASFFVETESGAQGVFKPDELATDWEEDWTSSGGFNPRISPSLREVGAYMVDRVLGLDVVPVTTTRRQYMSEEEIGTQPQFARDEWGPGEVQGSVQHVVAGGDWTDDMPNSAGASAQRNALDTGNLHKMAILDYVIGNSDRHMGNVLVQDDGRVYAIDNGYAFPTSDHYNPMEGEEVGARTYTSFAHQLLDNVGAQEIPEDLMAQIRDVDPKDMYDALKSLGMGEEAVLAVGRLQELQTYGELPTYDGKDAKANQFNNPGLADLFLEPDEEESDE